jgi:hypothetical protein
MDFTKPSAALLFGLAKNEVKHKDIILNMYQLIIPFYVKCILRSHVLV